MLENLKDENGQLKKPILFSLIGGAGLVGYLLLKGGSGSSSGATPVASTGQSSDLTGAIAALQTAVQGMATSSGTDVGGGTGSSGTASGGTDSSGGNSIDPPQTNPTPPTVDSTQSAPTPLPYYTANPIPVPAVSMIKTVSAAPGENGSSGGGGQGLVTVPTVAGSTGTVYAGLTHDQITSIKEVTAKVAPAAPVHGRTTAPVTKTLTVNQLSAIKEVPAPVVSKTSVNPIAKSKAMPV